MQAHSRSPLFVSDVADPFNMTGFRYLGKGFGRFPVNRTSGLADSVFAYQEVRLTKAELDAVPEDDRVNFLMLAQIANDLSMLRVLIIQAINGADGPKIVRETNLGLAFMLARILAGRVHEAWDFVRKASLQEAFEQHVLAVPKPDREEMTRAVASARASLTEYFGQSRPLLTLVRRKLAFHHDRAAVVGAYALTPDSFQLSDFHTGVRGTTFYGAADSLTALAASHLIGSSDPVAGQRQLVAEAPHIAGQVEEMIDGYLVAFFAQHLGIERFASAPTGTVEGLPKRSEARLYYLLAAD